MKKAAADGMRLEKCAVFASRSDERHLLYVPRSKPFPAMTHNVSQWRAVAYGVDPPPRGDGPCEMNGYFEVRPEDERDILESRPELQSDA